VIAIESLSSVPSLDLEIGNRQLHTNGCSVTKVFLSRGEEKGGERREQRRGRWSPIFQNADVP